MTVTFDIPNGSMEIVLDRFMPEAKIGQIRKAIKLMPDDKKQETAAWLKNELEQSQYKSGQYRRSKAPWKLKKRYEELVEKLGECK